MKDRLEEFVRDHSQEFDLFEPKAELWQDIEKKLGQQKKSRLPLYLSRIAAVAAIFVISFMVQRFFMKPSGNNTVTLKEAEINIPELKEAEVYYSGMINEKLNEVKPLLKDNPSLERELHTDLSELDSIYVTLKRDLNDNVANHEVIEAMIQNYRLRISILEDMLEYLEDQNSENTTNHINKNES